MPISSFFSEGQQSIVEAVNHSQSTHNATISSAATRLLMRLEHRYLFLKRNIIQKAIMYCFIDNFFFRTAEQLGFYLIDVIFDRAS